MFAKVFLFQLLNGKLLKMKSDRKFSIYSRVWVVIMNLQLFFEYVVKAHLLMHGMERVWKGGKMSAIEMIKMIDEVRLTFIAVS